MSARAASTRARSVARNRGSAASGVADLIRTNASRPLGQRLGGRDRAVLLEAFDAELRGADRLLGQANESDALLVHRQRLLELDLSPFERARDLFEAVERLFE